MRLRRLSTRNSGFEVELAALTYFEGAQDAAVEDAVKRIIADVRGRGDAAVLEYSRRFDRIEALALAELEVPRDRMQEALAGLPAPSTSLPAPSRAGVRV